MAWTAADATTYLQDRNRSDTTTRAARLYYKVMNDARLALSREGFWSFDKRFTTTVFQARYATGTIAVTAGGTTVTGTGTTFTSAMVGRMIRLNGENILYRITAYTSGTSITIQTYQGTADLTGKNYEILDERVAAPTRFRSFAWPVNDSLVYPRLYYKPLEEIHLLLRHEKRADVPYWYDVEWDEASSVPTPYFWVYPAPSDKRVIDTPYFQWPAEATTGTDVFELPAEAHSIHREYMKAYLFLEQGLNEQYQGQLGIAKGMAKEALSAFKAVSESDRRDEWDPSGDPPDGFRDRYNWATLASGEPQYT